MQFEFRSFTDADHEAAAEIYNLNWPDSPPQTAQQRRDNDARVHPERVFRRHAMFVGQRLIGTVSYGHMEWAYHPDKYALYVMVHPQFQSQGVATQAMHFVLQELQSRNALALRAGYREDRLAAAKLALRFGFVEDNRSFESHLNPQHFNFAPFEHRRTVEGYAFLSIQELQSDPDYQYKLYELDRDASHDVPLPPGEAWTFPTFERYCERVFLEPTYNPASIFVAVHQASGEWAATHMLWNTSQPNRLFNGLTGVRRQHRRKGLALALKLWGLSYAQRNGVVEIRTGNDARNRPMLSINEALGFIKDPAWIDVVKTLREET